MATPRPSHGHLPHRRWGWSSAPCARGRAPRTAGATVEAAQAFDSLAEDFHGLRDTSEYAQAAACVRGSRVYKDAVRAQRDDDRRQAQLSNELGTAIQQLLGDADGRLSALTTLRGSIATLRRAAEKENAGREAHVARRALSGAWIQALEASSALRARRE